MNYEPMNYEPMHYEPMNYEPMNSSPALASFTLDFRPITAYIDHQEADDELSH
jgi:hypothetical protein